MLDATSMVDATSIDREYLDTLSVEQLRDKLTFELAQLKHVQFGVKSERLNAEQRALFRRGRGRDIAALEEQLEQLTSKPADSPGARRCLRTCLG